jgi:zinc transporter ZupT
MIYLVAVAAFAATFLGGMLALRFRDKLHLVLGFSAGAVIGLAFFDLLPHALELGSHSRSVETTCLLVSVGFLTYLLLDRLVLFHAHNHEAMHADCDHGHAVAQAPVAPPSVAADSQVGQAHEPASSRGVLGAASMCLHTFLDGVAIGLGFQVSAEVGVVIALAVLAHDFSDGINTVGFLLKSGQGERRHAYRWLLLAGAAPLLGVLVTRLFTVSEGGLGAVMALFTGFFLYIGASELIPESYHSHPKLLTTLMTVLGLAVMFVVVQFAHGSGLHAHVH